MKIEYNVEPPRRREPSQFAHNRGFKLVSPEKLPEVVIQALSSIGILDDQGRGWAVLFRIEYLFSDLLVLRVI